jgi:hypothetical protein
MTIEKLFINKHGIQVVKLVDMTGEKKFYVTYTAYDGKRYELILDEMDEEEIDLLEPSHLTSL